MKSTYTVHDMTENVAEIWNTIIKINTHAHSYFRPKIRLMILVLCIFISAV